MEYALQMISMLTLRGATHFGVARASAPHSVTGFPATSSTVTGIIPFGDYSAQDDQRGGLLQRGCVTDRSRRLLLNGTQCVARVCG